MALPSLIRIQFFFFSVVGVLWLIVPAGAAASKEDSVHVELVHTSRLEFEPGQVGTVLFKITNNSLESRLFRLHLTVPRAWRALVPPGNVFLDTGDSSTKLISFQIPSDTPAGRYPLSLLVIDEQAPTRPVEAHATIDVLPVYRIGLGLIEAPTYVPAGEAYSVVFIATNQGNSDGLVELSLRSTFDLPVLADSFLYRLHARESIRIPLTVSTQPDLEYQIQHQVRATVRYREAPDVWDQAFSTVEIVPNTAQAMEDITLLPASLSMGGFNENGLFGQQVVLEVTDFQLENRSLNLLIRAPDLRDYSTFGQRDRYQFSYEDPRFKLQLGDHTYRLSPLSEIGRNGFGGRTEVSFGKVGLGGFYQHSRNFFPDQSQHGVFFNLSPHPVAQFDINYLGKRIYNEGEMISVRSQFRPVADINIDLEYGRGKRNQDWSDAFSADIRGRHSWGTYSVQYLYAGTDYPGTYHDLNLRSASLLLTPLSWLRLQGQLRQQDRFFWTKERGRVPQNTDLYRLGGGLYGRFSSARSYFTIVLRQQNRASPLNAVSREERALELSTGYNRSPWNLTTRGEIGQNKSPTVTKTEPFWLSSLSIVFFDASYSASTTVEYLSGSTFYSPIRQKRWTIGLGFSGRLFPNTQLRINTHISRNSLDASHSFNLIDGSLEHTLPFHHRIILSARLSTFGSGRAGKHSAFGINYSVPLSLPLRGIGPNRRITGRVYDAESGQGLQNILLSFGGASVLSDDMGQFGFVLPAQGVYYLVVDRGSIGLENITLLPMPLQIEIDGHTPPFLEIAITRSSVLNGVVIPGDLPASDATATVQEAMLETNMLSGIILELSNGDIVFRRITDTRGRFFFQDLIPGTWVLQALDSSLPENYTIVPDSTTYIIQPGDRHQVELHVLPRRRTIRFIQTDTVTVGIRNVGPIPVITTPSNTDTSLIETPQSRKPDIEVSLSDDIYTYIVQQDEWLASIARKVYNNVCLWPKIWLANIELLPDPDKVQPGMKLVIPPDEPMTQEDIRTFRSRYGNRD